MTEIDQCFDVAIIGAGLAGLVCAKALQQKGYHVVILEKSKGVGGRLATRRVDQTCFDHGLPYFFDQGKYTQQLIGSLPQNDLIQSSSLRSYQLDSQLQKHSLKPAYFSPLGITTIAKYIAESLTIWRNYRVISITPTQGKYWHINCETSADFPNYLSSKMIVSAVPAPQLLLLLQASHLDSFPNYFLETLQQVSYHPSLNVIAGYSEINTQTLLWETVKITSNQNLAWIGLENVKRDISDSSIFVLHSTPQYAHQFLDTTDLKPCAKDLLNEAAKLLFPPLQEPSWYQVHRWRYAIPSQSIPISCLSIQTPLPLIACGDWCAGHLNISESSHLEKAIHSGFSAAHQIESL